MSKNRFGRAELITCELTWGRPQTVHGFKKSESTFPVTKPWNTLCGAPSPGPHSTVLQNSSPKRVAIHEVRININMRAKVLQVDSYVRLDSSLPCLYEIEEIEKQSVRKKSVLASKVHIPTLNHGTSAEICIRNIFGTVVARIRYAGKAIQTITTVIPSCIKVLTYHTL